MNQITIPCIESVERTVKPSGGGAHVIVPKAWIGMRVAVVLLDEVEVK